ncbi:MAG: hypothetical protein ACR2NL_05080 [Acidimicrobiia bacterium]
MSQQITNPNRAFGYGVDDDPENAYSIKTPMLNGGSAAIAEGDVVTLTATLTASVGISCKQSDASADDDATVLGVAAEAIAVGDTGNVVVFGYAHVNVGDSSSITAGQVATLHATTDGAAANVTADATSVAGDYLAVFLGAEDLVGTNQAPVWVRQI